MSFEYRSIDFTEEFLALFASRHLSAADRSALLRALRLLDEDERHRSLRVHQLLGDRDGSWSVSASRNLRMTFERQPGGRKRMLTCSKHYDR
ncbi:MAG: hypothetical protein ACSLFM_01040 [Tepidiformaceae bacterium]